MTNGEIAKIFEITEKLYVLHNEDSSNKNLFKSIFDKLRRWGENIENLSITQIAKIGGMGEYAASKVIEVIDSATLAEYEILSSKTPKGIIELLDMKGLGPTNLRKLWIQLEITKAEELLLACRQDKLLKLKGFGPKNQEKLIRRLVFFLSMRGYKLYPVIKGKATDILSELNSKYPNNRFAVTGSIRRKEQILKKIDIVHTVKDISDNGITNIVNKLNYFRGTQVLFHYCHDNQFGNKLLESTGPEKFAKSIIINDDYTNEEDIFRDLDINYIPAELRHQSGIIDRAKNDDFSSLIKTEDIKGSIHMHTTDSDGINTLEEMIAYADNVGYEYIVISDHSQSAGYAGGLRIDRLLQQIDRIDNLNNKYRIQVYSGIESDILKDGSLDYPDDILSQLDVVIASIHSGLIMDIETATNRIIKAIENPHTRIMGHLTSRLLATREGYPVDHKKIIDACAANNTVMELNANPSRLDMDEQYIEYAMKKNVMISINPDAHSTSQLDMMTYGVNAARRGGLTKEFCLNTMNGKEFNNWVNP